MMLPLRKMTPLKASTQASAAASKIKNKMLNTSSFFKVSLKTNNKALAVALAAQRERSRQLEKEVVYLQKQVEGLCFELATRKYKHRKLLLILKDLHSNTLHHLDMVADLFSSDSDFHKLSEDCKTVTNDISDENLPTGGFTDQLPSQPEMLRDLLSPTKLMPPDKKLTENIVSAGRKSRSFTDNTCDEKRRSSQSVQPVLIGISRTSCNLKDDVERLSMKFSQSGYDMTSVNWLLNDQTTSFENMCEKSNPSVSDEPEQCNIQEKTVLLNATMETTASNITEIITVQSKTKKPGHTDKSKSKKNKEKTRTNVTKDLQNKKSADMSTDIIPQTDIKVQENFRDPEVNDYEPTKTANMSAVISRIPKLNKSQEGNYQKMTKDKDKSKPCDNTTSNTGSCDFVLPGLDDYVGLDNNQLMETDQNAILQPQETISEEARSKINCRRSKNKGKRLSSVIRKTFVISPSPFHDQNIESIRTNLQLAHTFNNSEANNWHKMEEDKSKSCNSTKSNTTSCDRVILDMDDYFRDKSHSAEVSRNITLQPQENISEDGRSKINYRMPKTKGRRVSSVNRKTFVISSLPSHESYSESNWTNLESVNNEVRGTYKPCQNQDELRSPEQSIFCDNVTISESEQVECLSLIDNKQMRKMLTAANPGGNQKSKCRETFVIRESPSSDKVTTKGDASSEAEKSTSARQQPESCPHSDKIIEGSSKRPWVTTQDSESFPDDMNHEEQAEDQGSPTPFTEIQKPKKARRAETSRSAKKKAVQKEDSTERKKNKKGSRSNKGLRSDNGKGDLVEFSDSSHLQGSSFTYTPITGEDQLHVLQAAESQSTISEEDEIFAGVNERKSRLNCNSETVKQQCRKTFDLWSPQNLTETFFLPSHISLDSVSPTKTTNISTSSSRTVEATEEVHVNLGDLLTDEMPPWTALDVSAADMGMGSVLCTPRRETTSKMEETEKSNINTTKASPGRVLTSLTNTITTPDSINGGRTRRRKDVVSYKEPSLNCV
ncbi:shugoshin 2-like isoform X2 [Sphaeramia orbicularis]|uniref:shugoshin 2-like isoform X2 n=1 Tax=Sphaeramia orbicularis TaxID=375764 RepID=UPI00117E648E|nr:shugoshin 2 isoform X2 [Sphaeramia orbicularis]